MKGMPEAAIPCHGNPELWASPPVDTLGGPHTHKLPQMSTLYVIST